MYARDGNKKNVRFYFIKWINAERLEGRNGMINKNREIYEQRRLISCHLAGTELLDFRTSGN